MRETIFLKIVGTNEVPAFLNDVDLQSRLQSLRDRINREIHALSGKVFQFVVASAEINTKQEQKYEVNSCAVRCADGKLHIEIKCNTSTPFVTSHAENEAESRLDTTTSHKETAKSAQEQSSYPNFYSDETIRETSDNLEKQAKIFFNSKLPRLSLTVPCVIGAFRLFTV